MGGRGTLHVVSRIKRERGTNTKSYPPQGGGGAEAWGKGRGGEKGEASPGSLLSSSLIFRLGLTYSS